MNVKLKNAPKAKSTTKKVKKNITPQPTVAKAGRNWGIVLCFVAFVFGIGYLVFGTNETKLPVMSEEQSVSVLITLLPSQLSAKQVALVIKACNEGDELACNYLTQHSKYFLESTVGTDYYIYGIMPLAFFRNMTNFQLNYAGISVVELLSMSSEEFCGHRVGLKQQERFARLMSMCFGISQETIDCLRKTRAETLNRTLNHACSEQERILWERLVQAVQQELGLGLRETLRLMVRDVFVPNFYTNRLQGGFIRPETMSSRELKPLLQELMFRELKKCLN